MMSVLKHFAPGVEYMQSIFLILSIIATLEISANEIRSIDFPFILPVSVEKTPLQLQIDKPLKTNKSVKENDDDNDGVTNRYDKCSQTPIGEKVDSNGCKPDSDKDGVFDVRDECPNTEVNFIVDEKGCPQIISLEVHFSKTSYKIASSYNQDIKKFANFLKDNQGYQVIIYGFTADQEGTLPSQELSQKRANAVMNVLMKHGVKLTKLTAIGMGSKNPVADNSTADGQAKNRRIEVELLK